MVTYGEHLRGMLERIIGSYEALGSAGAGPGELDLVCREVHRIAGTARAVLSLDPSRIHDPGFGPLRARLRGYLDDYSFAGEIGAMAGLYSGDPARVRNMRLKVMEALDDRGLMQSVREVAGRL